jgi:GntR family transcriptional regulator/MocR family aminotransferase
VLYVGTFSKVLFPALRLGYLVVPPALVDAFTSVRALADRGSPVFEQAVLAEFLREGHFARHIRRMRQLYGERQAVLIDAAGCELAGLVHVRPADAGMHLVGWLRDGVDDGEVSARAGAHGVEAPALSRCRITAGGPGGLLLGYTAFTREEIRAGVRRLASAFGP